MCSEYYLINNLNTIGASGCAAIGSNGSPFSRRGVLMRASFLGCPIDILTMAETVDLARDAMRNRQRLQHVALNVAKFVNMRLDPCSQPMSPIATL